MRVVGETEHTFQEDNPELKYETVTPAMRYLGHGIWGRCLLRAEIGISQRETSPGISRSIRAAGLAAVGMGVEKEPKKALERR